MEDQNFTHEMLDRFQKIIIKNKKQSTGSKVPLSRNVTRQISSSAGVDEVSVHELNEKINQLEAKLQRRDLTIINLRREAALAMLQTVDQTRLDGGVTRIIDRVLNNDDKVNQYEDEIGLLKRDQEIKTNELAAAKKQFQMELNRFENRVNHLENENFELQEKLKVSIAENKQKAVFLSGKDNILEQLNEMIRKRDEKYLNLEEKYATLMVQYDNMEQENLNLTNTTFDLNHQIDEANRCVQNLTESFMNLNNEKLQIQSTLKTWKVEYTNLTERFKKLSEQHENLVIELNTEREINAAKESLSKITNEPIKLLRKSVTCGPDDVHEADSSNSNTNSAATSTSHPNNGVLRANSLPTNFDSRKKSNFSLPVIEDNEDEEEDGQEGNTNTPINVDVDVDVGVNEDLQDSEDENGNNEVAHNIIPSRGSSRNQKNQTTRSTSPTTPDIETMSPRRPASGRSSRKRTLMKLKQTSELNSETKPPQPPPVKGRKSPRKMSLQETNNLIQQSPPVIPTVETIDAGTSIDLNLTRLSRIHRFIQTDMYSTEYGGLINQVADLTTDLEEKEKLIATLKNDILILKSKPQESADDQDAAVAEGSYGQRMLKRMMKQTTQGMQLEVLKKDYAELLDENQSLKDKITELESQLQQIQASQAATKKAVDVEDPILPEYKRTGRRRHDWETITQFQLRKDAETQCEQVLVNEISTQTIEIKIETFEKAVQTRPHGPIKSTPTLTETETFLGFIFGEVLDACKHFLSSNFIPIDATQIFDSEWNEFLYSMNSPSFSESFKVGENSTNRFISIQQKILNREKNLLNFIEFQRNCLTHIRTLIASLIQLRTDIVQEMKYRGGEHNSINSRTFIRCLDLILRTLERSLIPTQNLSSSDEKIIKSKVIIQNLLFPPSDSSALPNYPQHPDEFLLLSPSHDDDDSNDEIKFSRINSFCRENTNSHLKAIETMWQTEKICSGGMLRGRLSKEKKFTPQGHNILNLEMGDKIIIPRSVGELAGTQKKRTKTNRNHRLTSSGSGGGSGESRSLSPPKSTDSPQTKIVFFENAPVIEKFTSVLTKIIENDRDKYT